MLDTGSFSGCPLDEDDVKGRIDTTEKENDSWDLRVRVWSCWGNAGADNVTVCVDNHYLIDIVRNSSVTFKRYTGSEWSSISDTYAPCNTTGAGPDRCMSPPHTGSVHTYCVNMNTPPYTGSGTNLPTLQNRYEDPTQCLWNQAPGCYCRKRWVEGAGHDNKYYFVVCSSGHVVGKWSVSLVDRTAPCNCPRTGI